MKTLLEYCTPHNAEREATIGDRFDTPDDLPSSAPSTRSPRADRPRRTTSEPRRTVTIRSDRPVGPAAPLTGTGIEIGPRSRRRTRTRSGAGRAPLALLAVLFAGVSIAAAVGSGTNAEAEPVMTSTLLAETVVEIERTPRFATFEALELRLPVRCDDLTALAFHQASGDKALEIRSLLPDADMDAPDIVQRVASESRDPLGDIVGGTCLRMWRSNRTGEPNTAADIGARPGTTVYSPVTGTVTLVRPYQLYGKHDDIEVHIRPDGYEDVDLVLIHLDGVTVAAGERVEGGATRIGAVRSMSDKMDLQLGRYEPTGGNHVHLQINRVVPGEEVAPSTGS